MPTDYEAFELARFARVTTEDTLEAFLEKTKAQDIEDLKDAWFASEFVIFNYTGADGGVLSYPDVQYARKVLAAEMFDNRQFTAQYTSKNPLVMQILDSRSTNLLPSVEV